MDRIEIGYLWVLSLLGALFIGHEIALMGFRGDIAVAQNKLNNCHEVITGSTYSE